MRPSKPEAVEFRLLGPVEAVRNGSALALGGSRQQALLALLLREPGRPISPDRLAEELWQGKPPRGAATTVRSYVSRLRSVLGADAELTSSASGYALEVSPERIDANEFERLVREGEQALARGAARRAAERLRSALELWRGRPFAGLADEGALRLEAERLEELRLRALEERIDADLTLGQGADLVEELEMLVREHHYRERFWRQLMLALYRSERQADALAAYRRVRELLDEELGLEPGEELKELEQAILRQDVPPVRPPEERHNLPAQLTTLVGREAELADIEWLLGEARLVTLTGVGGVGKTRLAIEAAWRTVADFPGGVFFVDFSSLTESALVPRHVAEALDIREQPSSSVHEQLVERFRAGETLLVLDNCEHLLDPCAELAQHLLAECAPLRILATSRQLLGLPGEADYAVPPLALPPPEAGPEELQASEAVRLLLARARTARPRLSEDPSVLASAGRICRDLDGLPLAIELAAARAKALSLEEIAGRLADRFRFLVSWRRLTTARHRTLREALNWSYDLLTADEQALLGKLSVFAGGFTVGAVSATCLGGDEERALELLGRLVDASLVIAEEREGEIRYRLLETVRQYAAARLGETAAGDATMRAFAQYFLDDAESAYASMIRGEVTQWPRHLAWFDAEQDNLRVALDAAPSIDPAMELRLAGALWRYWWVRGLYGEGRTRLATALERGGSAEPAARARALNGIAGLAWSQGDYEQARAFAADAITAAQAAHSIWDELTAHNVLGVTALHERKFDLARRHLGQAALLAQEHGYEAELPAIRLNLGIVALESGELATAVDTFEDLLAYHRAHGIAEGVGFALLNLGLARYRTSDHSNARSSFEEARAAFDSIGFRAHVAHALQGLAAVEAHVGSARLAATLLGRADALLAEAPTSADDFDAALLADAEAVAHAALGNEMFWEARGEGRRLAGLP